MPPRASPHLPRFQRERNRPALPAALAALGAVLALGGTGPAIPGFWELLAPFGLLGIVGLVIAGGAALLATHLARITVSASTLVAAALPAALVPVAVLPGIGAPALVLPLALAMLLAARCRSERPAATLALLGTVAAAAGAGGGGSVVAVLGLTAMLAAAGWIALPRRAVWANDNAPAEPIWRAPGAGLCCPSQAIRHPGKGD